MAELNGDHPRLIFLVLAHNEASVLERCLQAVIAQAGEQDQLHVVADHCHDRTAAIAHSSGAIVHIRSGCSPRGKAAALLWWVRRQEFDPDQAVVILDADSVILPGFTDHIRTIMTTNTVAAQATLVAEASVDAPIGRLIALSERMDQHFFDSLRSRIGGPVRLRGTGMALRFGALQKYSPGLRTKTEDVELTLLLVADHARILPAFRAKLLDPKPDIPKGAINQRARWLQGQVGVLLSYPGLILSLLIKNPLGFLAVMNALTKPRTIFSLIRVVLSAATAASVLSSDPSPHLLTATIAVFIWLNLPELLGLSYTLWKSPHRKEDIGALTALPAFLLLWVRSIVLAGVSRAPWLCVRPECVTTSLNETAAASN